MNDIARRYSHSGRCGRHHGAAAGHASIKSFLTNCVVTALAVHLVAGAAAAQLSSSAFRVLGQPDLRQNGLNGVTGVEVFAPSAVAVDQRGGEVHLYVADTGNNRILAWRNAQDFQLGKPADLALGQPNLTSTVPLAIGVGGLNVPTGVAVHPPSGDVYVADTENHRVLRFPSPFANPGRVEPNAVFGQPNFSARNPNTGGISERSMRTPSAVAFDQQGNLWVVDRGNHRVLRFPAGVLDSSDRAANLVLGQPNFFVGSANGGLGGVTANAFNTPAGLAFDAQGSLYVADFTNARVLVFTAPQNSSQAASRVIGQPNFESNGVPPTPSSSSLRGPLGLEVSPAGSLFVGVPLDNRVLVYNNVAQAPAGVAADRVLGQIVVTTSNPNINTHPLAGSRGLFGPTDVAIDPNGNIFIADSLNNRVVGYAAAANDANKVWGQTNFNSNGPNGIEAGSISGIYDMAIDYSRDPFPLYASDTNNHRVLIWRDSTRFRDGAPADLVIGQPDLTTAVANSDTGVAQSPTATSLSGPRGIALDAAGNLFVADPGNNRVLRFPKPLDQSGRITADLVLGQTGFSSDISAAVSATSLRAPSDVAIGPQGDIFVSDTGNNRVLQYASNPANGSAAVRVFGQQGFGSGNAPSEISAQSAIAVPARRGPRGWLWVLICRRYGSPPGPGLSGGYGGPAGRRQRRDRNGPAEFRREFLGSRPRPSELTPQRRHRPEW
jgi:sugar lactone lactonase YvrE